MSGDLSHQAEPHHDNGVAQLQIAKPHTLHRYGADSYEAGGIMSDTFRHLDRQVPRHVVNFCMIREVQTGARHTIADTELSADYIVPSVFNRAVAPAVATAVAQAAAETGVARRRHAPASA